MMYTRIYFYNYYCKICNNLFVDPLKAILLSRRVVMLVIMAQLLAQLQGLRHNTATAFRQALGDGVRFSAR